MPKCDEEGCKAAQTGICINKFADLAECTHYKPDENDDAGEAEPDDSKPSKDVHVGYSGSSLLLEEVNKISLANHTRVVILAGMHDVGKTTALLSLMHLIETGSSYCDYLFAGSKTLIDFEEKAWPSRMASKKDAAATVRTPDIEPKFLHLRLAPLESPLLKKDIVFTDVSGELFKMLKDSKAECQKFFLAKRADHFALFFDAGSLSEMSARTYAKTSGLAILKSLTEVGVLQPVTRVQIVFSSWDLYLGKDDKEKYRPFIESLRGEIESKYGKIFNLTFHEIASRPSKSELSFGYGLKELFSIWMQKSQLDFNESTVEKLNAADVPGSTFFSQYFFK